MIRNPSVTMMLVEPLSGIRLTLCATQTLGGNVPTAGDPGDAGVPVGPMLLGVLAAALESGL